ncbi:ABC transporter ATP-binding protein [Streptomyces sp. G5(2025)]|uniref:ABC transporter ATP-binding protein n=1 Tax=Streptomyces sp. G5(2025) TaxID=3406628 RepID=UPI003C1AD816
MDLTVRPGEIVALLGPNGAGESTVCLAAAGLLTPTRGQVYVAGRNATRDGAVRRSRAGVADNLVVAQEWRGGDGGFVADLLAAPTRRTYEAERRQRAQAVLRACGLQALAGQYAGALPVGQARMVELARAVADPPGVLLLDEPASGMTADERRYLSSVIRHLADEEGCAVLLVEHNVAFVMELCARVIVLGLGRVLAEGTAADVRADPRVRDAYLG